MLDTTENVRLFTAVAACLGVIVAGVGNALAGPRRWGGQLLIGSVGVAVAVGFLWPFAPERATLIGGVGAAALALLTAGRTSLARRVGAAFRTPRARWAAVAAVGAAVLGYEVVRFDRAEQASLDANLDELMTRVDRADAVPVPGVRLVTAQGHAVAAMMSANPRTAEQLRQSEELTLAGSPYRAQLIHRGPPSDTCNCHGWVFTGGQYGVAGRDVETILADNGYTVVTDPQPGDACVYRTSTGIVCHSALVRGILGDGTVLVEGKWGWMGVYLHPVGSSDYGQNYHYYRTDRGSHLLTATTGTPTGSAVPMP